ncbi:deoxyuridine 5'-triphosphate nucleotidohydrolase [Bacillus sp. 166amftsu]|uniref:dUTP diphosphatase n=1 Tax=Bacillus sp. 166amftsu TaxID=1761753 RepID=UPI00089A870A|nr:deoxyuridine 5'-triphosphate nucleotidohydrolase [Bacillus sp. 166amftsu]SDZ40392.1 deoxyuridine 5'-triphosphate nucleotidohydrolase [Bacillus sp. 166amftsu]
MNLRVKIKRLKESLEIPRYTKLDGSGFDLIAAEDIIIWPGETKVVPTGLAFEIPPGYELQVRPHIEISSRTKLRVVLETVYSGYSEEVGVIVDNIERTLGTNMKAHVIERGTCIARGVIVPIEMANFVEVKKLSDSKDGTSRTSY